MILTVGRKFCHLPRLSLVFAEVLDGERPDTRNPQEPFARSVDCKPAQITSNPASVQLLGNSGCCATPNEAIEHQIIFARRRFHYALKKNFGFLGRIAEHLVAMKK